MKLYIFGNGFDLAHGLNTRYSNYRDFILQSNKEKWKIVLEYYPKNHRFWSDVEHQVCLIDISRFKEMVEARRMFGIAVSGLDDLLEAIHDSFNSFILDVESSLSTKSPYFELDKDALFLSFNYTTTLETLYQAKRVIHLHNSAEGVALNKLFRIGKDDCILGHSPIYADYPFYADSFIGNDKDYIAFRNKTTKKCKEIWDKYNLNLILLTNQNIINEVVFYGFSFSKADKYYLQQIFLNLPTHKCKYIIYYHVDYNESQDEKLESIKEKIRYAGGDCNQMTFVNDKAINKI